MTTLAQSVLAADISYYQKRLDPSYRRSVVIMRLADGTFLDPNFSANRAMADKLIADQNHPLEIAIWYVVYRPGCESSTVALAKRAMGSVRAWEAFMDDVETWGGQITGNRSSGITQQIKGLAGFAAGDARRVIAYGNRGDLASLFPNRPAGLKLIIASYGSSIVTGYPGMIGQQYTDGEPKWGSPSGLPLSSAPFGNCDHNVFPGLTVAALKSVLGLAGGAPVKVAATTTPEHIAVADNYRLGDVTAAIKTVQTRLNVWEANPKLTVDGAFGVRTQVAVKAFQTAHHLSVDGIVGPKTLAALNAAPPVPFKSSRVLIVKGDSPATIAKKAGVSVAVITAAFAGIGVAANKIPISSIVTCGSVSKCSATVPKPPAQKPVPAPVKTTPTVTRTVTVPKPGPTVTVTKTVPAPTPTSITCPTRCVVTVTK